MDFDLEIKKKNCKVFEEQTCLQKQALQLYSLGFHIALEIVESGSPNESEMAEENRNNGNNQQQVVHLFTSLLELGF